MKSHKNVREFTLKMSRFLEDGTNTMFTNIEEIWFSLILKNFSSQNPSWSSKIWGKQV